MRCYNVFFIFSIRCNLFINFRTKKIRRLFFFRCFFILNITVFFLLTFFSCFRWWILLYDVIVIVAAFASRWVLVFATITYVVRTIMIFVVLHSIFFSLMFIFFSVNEICFFIVNVDSKPFTRWRSDSDLKTSISSIDLSCRKLLSIHWFRHEAGSCAEHVIPQNNSLNPE